MAEQHGAPWHYRPGEMVVATELPVDPADRPAAHSLIRETLEQQLAGSVGGVFHPEQSRTEALVFEAPDRPPLGFLFFDLAEQPHDFVKKVISAAHPRQLEAMAPVRDRGFRPLGVMPHWLASAQQNYSDGSPASFPRPAQPDTGGRRYRYRYTPRESALDFRPRLQRTPDGQHVPVLILDTRPDWERARRQAEQFAATNAQLSEIVDLLGAQALPAWHADALDACEREALTLARGPGGGRGDQDISDHALFVAGLIHDLSAGAELHIRPVLNRFGVGDLHLLLRVLQDVVASKPRNAPLIVNMSLGFAPRLEHLPWIWYGVDMPHESDFLGDVPIRDQQHSVASLASAYQAVDETTRLLHGGLDQLADYLLANNCLGVAAAGNDSLPRVESGKPRLGPRIPARYHSILGVAATLTDPSQAAPYSNAGDEMEYGDHVSTFGGDVTHTGEPADGVVGVYSAPTYPQARGQHTNPRNTSGWAMWSGTSFATAIAAGLVSGYWTTRPDASAEDILRRFNDLAGSYAPALRTPAIGIRGEWQSS